MSLLDGIVFFLVLVLTFAAVGYGHWKRSRVKDPETFLDFLLMGRALTLPMFVATLVATWYGGIFGVTRIAFEKGIFNFVTQGVFWYVTYLIFALFLVQRVRRIEAATLPELVGKMFGPRSHKLSAVFNFFNVVPIAYAISVGILIQSLFGVSLWVGTFLGTAVVVLYSFAGGFRSVVFSDLVQFFVMCLAVALVLLISVGTYGGLDFLKANLPSGHFDPTGGNSFASLLVWGLIALSTLVDPNFYQRCFAAQSTRVARNGIFVSTMVWFLFDICTTFGAMYARAVMPDADPADAYLTYALTILPSGLKGFFLAGILATILSTMDSYLFIAGTTLSHDLFPEKYRDQRLYHSLSILFVGVLAVGMAIVFEGNLRLVWKTLGSYSAACLLLPVMVGYLFPGRIADREFVATCIFAAIGTTYWRHVSHSGFWADIDEIYIGSAISLLMMAVFLVRRPAKIKQKGLV